MLAEERRDQILKTINKKGSVHVTELSNNLEVTEETIRRDLEILNEKKLLKRTHGGAISNTDKMAELSFNIRRDKNAEEKQAIASKAVKLIEPEDTIFIDASSTSLFMCRELENLNNVTIITNSARIVFELAKKENISVISTGGLLRRNSLSYVGPLANETIKKYHADKFFASCKGVSPEYGATDSNELEIEVKKNMARHSRKTYIMGDHTKLNIIGLTRFVSMEHIDKIITGDNVEQRVLDSFGDARHKFI